MSPRSAALLLLLVLAPGTVLAQSREIQTIVYLRDGTALHGHAIAIDEHAIVVRPDSGVGRVVPLDSLRIVAVVEPATRGRGGFAALAGTYAGILAGSRNREVEDGFYARDGLTPIATGVVGTIAGGLLGMVLVSGQSDRRIEFHPTTGRGRAELIAYLDEAFAHRPRWGVTIYAGQVDGPKRRAFGSGILRTEGREVPVSGPYFFAVSGASINMLRRIDLTWEVVPRLDLAATWALTARPALRADLYAGESGSRYYTSVAAMFERYSGIAALVGARYRVPLSPRSEASYLRLGASGGIARTALDRDDLRILTQSSVAALGTAELVIPFERSVVVGVHADYLYVPRISIALDPLASPEDPTLDLSTWSFGVLFGVMF